MSQLKGRIDSFGSLTQLPCNGVVISGPVEGSRECVSAVAEGTAQRCSILITAASITTRKVSAFSISSLSSPYCPSSTIWLSNSLSVSSCSGRFSFIVNSFNVSTGWSGPVASRYLLTHPIVRVADAQCPCQIRFFLVSSSPIGSEVKFEGVCDSHVQSDGQSGSVDHVSGHQPSFVQYGIINIIHEGLVINHVIQYS